MRADVWAKGNMTQRTKRMVGVYWKTRRNNNGQQKKNKCLLGTTCVCVCMSVCLGAYLARCVKRHDAVDAWFGIIQSISPI